MDKKTIRTGIVGAGFAARFHYECLKRVHSADVEIEGVYAIDTEQAAEYAKKRGIRNYDSLEKLIEKVDVIHVCTPPVVHEQIAVAALGRDKFAIVEKPLTGYFVMVPKISTAIPSRSNRPSTNPWPASNECSKPKRKAKPRYSTLRTGSMPLRFRKSEKSSRKPARRYFGCSEKRHTPAHTPRRTLTGNIPVAARQSARPVTH